MCVRYIGVRNKDQMMNYVINKINFIQNFSIDR